jgi:MFS family permease
MYQACQSGATVEIPGILAGPIRTRPAARYCCRAREGFMKYQHRVLGMLSLLAVITYLDRICIAVAGPRMQDALHISPEAWGWVTSVFFLSYSAFEMPTGALGDRLGPRRVLTRIVAWWSAFTTLTGTVSNYYLLLLVRFCFGAGEARRLSQCICGHRSLDPDGEAHACLGHRVDDQSSRCGLVTTARRADSSPLWLAGAVLCLRSPGSGLESGLVRPVSGFATQDAVVVVVA